MSSSGTHATNAQKHVPCLQKNALLRSMDLVRSLMASRNRARKRSFVELYHQNGPEAVARAMKRRKLSNPSNRGVSIVFV